jgi:acyl dehydratase
MAEPIFYEDVVPGERLRVGPYRVERDEMVAFAQAWDPLPPHVDEAAGIAAGFGGLTAPGIYVMAVKQRLILGFPLIDTVIASFGYDEVRFLQPMRPGDAVYLELEWLEKRPSSSKQDRGIVKQRFTLVTEDGRAVMRHLDTVLMRRRTPKAEGEAT